jgi:alanyl aminopeptidase
MLETWTGEEPFKQGVRDYLNAHADGNATTADLFSALDNATQKPLGQTAATFVDQPGTPLIDVALDCSGPKPQVALTQSRYLPAGSQAAQTGPWRVPVCLRYEEADGTQGRTCVMLDAPSQRLDLDAKTCPKWLHPNADEQGYYLWRLPTDQLLALIRTHRAKLSLPERVALPQHLGSLLRAEVLPADAYLSALEELAKDDHWMVIQGVVNGLGPLGYTAKRTPDLRAPYAAYVRRVLGPHLKRLGLDARPNEPVEAQLLRPSLISVMVHQGDDPKVKAHVRKQAEAFLKGDPKIPVEVGRSALSLAALDGDEALWNKLKDAFPKAQTPAMRGALLGGLGNFSDPKLVERSLGLLLDGTLRSQDFWAIVGPPMRNEELHALVWTWGTSRYDELVKFLGPKSAPGLPNLSSGFCSAEGRAKTEQFFSDPKRAPEGTQRNLALALERIDYCVRMQTTHAPTLKTFLGKKK